MMLSHDQAHDLHRKLRELLEGDDFVLLFRDNEGGFSLITNCDPDETRALLVAGLRTDPREK